MHKTSNLKTLVVGTGGREHALVHALKCSPSVAAVYAWPGNDGLFLEAERTPVAAGDTSTLVQWVRAQAIDLVVIGPEAELVSGLSDHLRAAGVTVFGPAQEAAQLEGSKILAKQFMREHHVPTARAEVVESVAATLRAAEQFAPPYVLKADGLAAGKGVFICATLAELESAAKELFVAHKLGAAGERALLEEYDAGHELSVLVLTNGREYEILPLTRDHKRLGDSNKGPNTGGMGVVGPVAIDARLRQQIEDQIVRASVQGLAKSGMLYRGILFIGVMVTADGPKVLEYNVRFGDPETQVVLPLLASGEWAQALLAVARGDMPKLTWAQNQFVTCVVAAAEGYPEQPVKGVPLQGDLKSVGRDSYVLHAGTKWNGHEFVTNGGRVLNVMGVGGTAEAARAAAYRRLQTISWPGMQWRKDIGLDQS